MKSFAGRLLLTLLMTLLPLARFWGESAQRAAISWPPPPEPARILLTGSFSGPAELGIQRGGLLQFLHDLLLGKEDQRLSRPYGVAVSREGDRICVADPGQSAIHLFDLQARAYSQIREAGGKKLLSPIGVAFDPKGRLFVSDSERAEVLVFDRSLRLLFSFGHAEHLQRPTGLAPWGEDGILVVDTAAHQVLGYRASERSAREILRFGRRGTAPGEFNYPSDITVSRSGHVYVNDGMNYRIQVFDASGMFLRTLGRPGDTTGSFQRSKGVAVDSEENLYVVDALSDTVQIFDQSARFLLNFGGPGAAAGEFWMPSGVAIDASDRIYVVDTYNHRVQTFQRVKGGAVARPGGGAAARPRGGS